MAWLFQRATTGLQYTPFEFDQSEDYSRKPYIPFVEGKSPLMPVEYIASARQVKQTNGRLPDVFTERTHHICNQRFRDLVESFEPDVHFFRQISLRRKNGEPLDPHYLWTIGQDVDCILTAGLSRYWEQSAEGGMQFSIYDLENDAHFKRPKDNPAVIRISKDAVAGLHLWTGGMLGFNNEVRMFMSDTFYAAWREGKFSNLRFRSIVEEVDEPWTAEKNMELAIESWRDRENMIASCWPATPARRGKC